LYDPTPRVAEHSEAVRLASAETVRKAPESVAVQSSPADPIIENVRQRCTKRAPPARAVRQETKRQFVILREAHGDRR
jgi:hypothetical protein